MKDTTIFVWGIAAVATGNLTYSAIRHHMPVIDVIAMTLLCLYAAKAGAQNLANYLWRDKTGADQS